MVSRIRTIASVIQDDATLARATTVEEAHAHAHAVLAGHANMLLRMTPEQHAELDELAAGHDDVDTLGVWRRGPRS